MANTYKALSTVTVGAGGAATISFTNIPQTYTDLKIVLSTRSTDNSIADNMLIAINGSSSNFTGRFLFTNTNGTISSGNDTTASGAYNGATATANTFSNVEIYFPNYVGSNNKSFSVDSVAENNATQSNMYIDAKLWSNTAAITSIAFTPTTGNFVQYSTATLYGVFNADVSSAPATPTIGTATTVTDTIATVIEAPAFAAMNDTAFFIDQYLSYKTRIITSIENLRTM